MSTLDDILQKHIALSKDDTKTARSIVKNIICTDFISHMKNSDKTFAALYRSVYYTGSFYQGLKIIHPNEFDLNLVLNIKPRHFRLITYKDADVPHGFAKYLLHEDNENPEAKFICNGYLSPKKLRDWFKGVFTKAFDKLNTDNEHDNYMLVKEFKYTESGPAMTIRIILKDSGDEICVDLVPVVPVVKNDCVYLVPKLHPRDDLLWRLSYPNVELKILKDKSGPKSVIKYLKLLYHNSTLQKLCSYYIKTLVMLDVDENGSWAVTENKDYLLTILNKLKQAMEAGVLPSVHDREFNLFHLSDLTGVIRNNNIGKLKRIIRDFENDEYEKHLIGRKGDTNFQSQCSYVEASFKGNSIPNQNYRNSQYSHEYYDDLDDILENDLPPPDRSTLVKYNNVPDEVFTTDSRYENMNRRVDARIQRQPFEVVSSEEESSPTNRRASVSTADMIVGGLAMGVLAMGAYHIYKNWNNDDDDDDDTE